MDHVLLEHFTMTCKSWVALHDMAHSFIELDKAVVHELVQGNAKECSNYCTMALISHTSKVMLKILQVRLQQYMKHELPDVQAGFRKGRGTKVKLPVSTGSLKKQESSRKVYTSALLTIPKTLTVDHNKLWKILKEMRIPDHLTCFLRNRFTGQEATDRTGHGSTDWFQIGKGVHQGYILSPSLFHLYAEYIIRNVGLD